MIASALLGLLSDRARGERLHVVSGFGTDTPSTRAAVAQLAALGAARNVLIVLERGDEVGVKSVRNLPEVHVLFADQLNAYDVVTSDDVVFTEAALTAFIASRSKTEEASE
jgi:large subunit ribosomal protein L4